MNKKYTADLGVQAFMIVLQSKQKNDSQFDDQTR